MLPRLLLTVVLFAGLVSAQENNGDKIIKPETGNIIQLILLLLKCFPQYIQRE